MPEGSVMLDGIDSDVDTEETETDENFNNSDESEETEGQASGEQSQETETQEQPQDGGQTTDKGTKLDPNPMSAINQQLANERRKVQEYESFMSDPEQVERYLEELRKELGETKPTADPKDEISLEQVQTREDVVKFLDQERRKDKVEIDNLKKTISGFMQTQGELAVGQRIRSQIEEARRKYPAINPVKADGSPNPDFDPELEKQIGEAFDELDYDPRTQSFRGQVDFLKLVDRFMTAAKRGESAGSRKAQTVIQDRRTGRVVTGTQASSDSPDESNMTPSQKIAARLQRVASKRR